MAVNENDKIQNDHKIIFILRLKERKTIKDRVFLRWLEQGYPSYNKTTALQIELINKGYIVDLNARDSSQDENGNWINANKGISEFLSVTHIGCKAINSSELRSEKYNYYFTNLPNWVAILISTISLAVSLGVLVLK